MSALWQDQLAQVDALRRQADALAAQAETTRCGIWATVVGKRCLLDAGHDPAGHDFDLDLSFGPAPAPTP